MDKLRSLAALLAGYHDQLNSKRIDKTGYTVNETRIIAKKALIILDQWEQLDADFLPAINEAREELKKAFIEIEKYEAAYDHKTRTPGRFFNESVKLTQEALERFLFRVGYLS